ncbi:MAG: efflux RND transporter periplasmic adaptor subunit [Kangiellaceae bacterium]|nr:efflux RND transporter periplasmic adaptor subunit [Kangiellaceae bacterium]
MIKQLRPSHYLIIGGLIGIALSFILFSLLLNNLNVDFKNTESDNDVEQPLYWVAPMDPNYKRDKPGLSPMGMDLVPVFDKSGSDTAEKGVVKISPEVINNLGVRTVEARLKRLETKIKTVGYVKYDEDQLVHIHPRVEGWIEKLHVKSAGDPVKKGAPLYQIYSPALVNAQEELLLALERKNSRLTRASEDRLAALQLPSVVIKKLKKTRKIQQTITFFAPQDGVVDNLNIREGFYVKPGTTIMSIGQLNQVWVEAEIFERQSSQVTQGDAVSMSLDYLPGHIWQGRVDYVYPTLDPQTRTSKVRLRFENKNNRLKPNMFAQVVIYPDVGKDSLLIPIEAVIRSGNSDRVVLAMGEGRFKSINVKIGRFDDHSVEILSGIQIGDFVVTSAQFLVDSESSKTSDFNRMLPISAVKKGDVTNDYNLTKEQARVTGIINTISPDHRKLNISRGPVEKWGRAAATLDFIVSDSIALEGLQPGSTINFVFSLVDGEFIISEITSPVDKESSPARVESKEIGSKEIESMEKIQ